MCLDMLSNQSDAQAEKKKLPSWMTDPKEKKELMAKKMKTNSLFK